MSTQKNLVLLDRDNIQFVVKPDSHTSYKHFSIRNRGNASIAFKIKSKNDTSFAVSPTYGKIGPDSSQQVQVTHMMDDSGLTGGFKSTLRIEYQTIDESQPKKDTKELFQGRSVSNHQYTNLSLELISQAEFFQRTKNSIVHSNEHIAEKGKISVRDSLLFSEDLRFGSLRTNGSPGFDVGSPKSRDNFQSSPKPDNPGLRGSHVRTSFGPDRSELQKLREDNNS